MADARAVFRIEGQDATAAAFNSATRNARKSAGDMEGAFKRAFGGMAKAAATFVSFRALTSAVKETLDFADSLNKAATQAGLTTEAMSELAYAAKLSGVETNQLSAAFRFMQKGLSEASQGIGELRLAIKALGLSLDDIRKLKPDEQFELIADRIAMLPDPADRARAAMKMFGDSGAQLLPMMEQGAEGVRKLREEAERLGQSFSKEQLDRLTAAKDSIDRMKSSFDSLSVTLVSKVAPGLTRVFDSISAFVSGDEVRQLELKLARVQRLMLEMTQRGQTETPFVLGIEGSGQTIEQLQKQASALRRELDNLRGVDRPTYRRGRATNRDGAPVVPGFVDPMAGLQEVVVQSSKIMTTAMQQFYDTIDSDTRSTLEKATAEFEAFRAKLEELLGAGVIDTETYNLRMKDFLDSTLQEVEVTSKKIYIEAEKQASTFQAFAEQAAANMQTALADFLFDPFERGLKGMLAGFIDTIRRMVAEVAAQQILTALFSQYTNSGGFLGAFAKKITGNAMGGPVQSGTPYIVGERGPELFVPGYNGSIVPNTKMGGSVTVAPVYNINASGNQDLAKQLPSILAAQVRQTVELARRAINEDISRGALGRA